MCLVHTVRLVTQRADGDCGIAALATLLSRPYEDVETAMTADGVQGRQGAYQHELMAAAVRLERVLARRYRYDVEAATAGVLMAIWNEKTRYRGHYVVLLHGVVIDPADGTIAPVQTYLTVRNARVGALLQLVA